MTRDNLTRLAALAIGSFLIGCGAAEPDEPVDKAVRDLSSAEPSVRLQAAVTLATTDDKMPELAPLLEKGFKEPDDRVRIWMVSAFMRHATEKKKVLPLLLDMLKSPHDSVRSSAASCIGDLGADGSSAASALAKALTDDPCPYVRRGAAISLSEIKPDPKAVIPGLLKGMEEKGTDVRWFSAEALGKLGPQGKAAVPALLEILKESPSASEDLSSASRALGDIGPSAEPAIPALIDLVSHKDLGVRRDAIMAIGEIGRRPDLSIPALAQVLEDPYLREDAAMALGRFAPLDEAKRALEAHQKDPNVKDIIQEELLKFRPKKEEKVKGK